MTLRSQVGRDLGRHVGRQVIHHIGPAGVGSVYACPASQVVINNVGEVVVVVSDFDQLLQRIVDVTGPDRLHAAAGWSMELLHTGDQVSNVLVGFLLDTICVRPGDLELG